MIRALVLIVFSFSLMSCSSWFKRRECNKTNWFAHGEKVAMSGKRLDADPFINECKKVEAEISHGQLDRGFKKGMKNYCQPETAYETGRKGKKLSKDLCDGPGWRKLVAKHEEGVRAYCDPDNGNAAGATGEKYNYICPKNMEKAFLVEFNKGRKKYLEGEVAVKREEIQNIDQQIRDLKKEGRDLRGHLANVNRGGRISIRHGFRTIQVNDSTSKEERDKIRQDLENDIRDVKYKVQSKQRERKAKFDELTELRREIAKL